MILVEKNKNMPVTALKEMITEEVLETGVIFTFETGETFNFKIRNGYSTKKRDQMIKHISSARKLSGMPSMTIESEIQAF